ncbi:MAG: hypothetical protein KC620_01980, partial [Myxococcales bacterium]|nr:hypothetical protein [Myxococcales bacterium]
GGVLIGAGGGLADIFARGADFATSMPVIEARYPEPHDRRLLLLLAQHIWDPIDAGLWIDAATDGFGANPARPVLLLTIPNDRRVPNDTTWFLARTAQLPIIEGSRFLPWGVPVIEGPHTGSALMVLSSLSEPPDHRALLTDARALSIIGRYLLSATIDPT